MKKTKLFRLAAWILTLAVMALLTVACTTAKPLFSLSSGGGYGTVEDTATTTVTVYDNGTVRVSRLKYRSGAVKLSEEDFQQLLSLVTREKLEDLEVEKDESVCDGGSTYITLYGDDGEVLVKKGGYSPKPGEYTQLYTDIRAILNPYIVD